MDDGQAFGAAAILIAAFAGLGAASYGSYAGHNADVSVYQAEAAERRAARDAGQAAEPERLRLIEAGAGALEAYCISHAHLRTAAHLRRVECSDESVSHAGVSIFDS